MRKGWKIFLGIVFVFTVLIILEILFPDKFPDKIITEKKPTILLIDAIDLSQDDAGQKMIYWWISKNYERLVKEFALKGVILSYQPGSLANYDLAVRLQEWLEKKLKKEKEPIWGVVPSLELGLLFASNLFQNPSVFHDEEKYLIFLTRHSSLADLENLEIDFTGVKIIVIPIPEEREERKEREEKKDKNIKIISAALIFRY